MSCLHHWGPKTQKTLPAVLQKTHRGQPVCLCNFSQDVEYSRRGLPYDFYLNTAPTKTPRNVATPPMSNMRNPLLTPLVPKIFALTAPRTNNNTSPRKTETGKAVETGSSRYGNSGTNPEIKYERNMITPPTTKYFIGSPALETYSSAERSERKLPAAIENASTKIKTIPARNMVPTETPAVAMPARSPVVETRLSSTPKIKLRVHNAKKFREVWSIISPIVTFLMLFF